MNLILHFVIIEMWSPWSGVEPAPPESAARHALTIRRPVIWLLYTTNPFSINRTRAVPSLMQALFIYYPFPLYYRCQRLRRAVLHARRKSCKREEFESATTLHRRAPGISHARPVLAPGRAYVLRSRTCKGFENTHLIERERGNSRFLTSFACSKRKKKKGKKNSDRNISERL